jgi:hypothetical protein
MGGGGEDRRILCTGAFRYVRYSFLLILIRYVIYVYYTGHWSGGVEMWEGAVR